MQFEDAIYEGFQGAVRVSKAGKVLFEKACGYADLPNKRENTMDTRFAAASVSKGFVAVGILKLVEDGKLALDDALGKLLGADVGMLDKNVTVAELLTHSSGIPDYLDEDEDYSDEMWGGKPCYSYRSPSDIFPLFFNKPAVFARGERFCYNNGAFVILAYIIERVSGMPFDEYLNENVFLPADMSDTGYYPMDELPARCANNYIYDDELDKYHTNIYSIYAKGVGDGGVFTTVDDLERFWNALLSDKLLCEKLRREMMSVKIDCEEDSDFYGYGMWLEKNESGEYDPYLRGCDLGVDVITRYYPADDILVTVTSNYNCGVWCVMCDLYDAAIEQCAD